MKDRRKSQRESVKNIGTKGNKVAKIIFYKSIALPIATLVIGLTVFLFVMADGFWMIHGIESKTDDIKAKIEKLKEDEKRLKSQNIDITRRLARTDTYMVDTQKVLPLVEKIISILKLKHLVSDIKVVNIENDKEYQNVVNISLEVFVASKYLNLNIVKDIIALVLDKILYVKEIVLENNLIKIQVYKKVAR